MQSRPVGKKGLAEWQVAREDDVRDLLYAMLLSFIADIHTEEPIPSIAGTHKFVDLASRIARSLIEVKWIATRGTYKSIIGQIHDDVQSYYRHPDCETVVFMVVDGANTTASLDLKG